jgi:hypothetical protein
MLAVGCFTVQIIGGADCQQLQSRHHATTKDAPSELNLDVSHKRQAKAKKNLANNQASTSTNDPLAWVQALGPVLGAFLANRAPPTPEPPVQHTPVIPAESNPHLNQVPHLAGTKRPAEGPPLPDICPDIGLWLSQLDTDPIRGRLNLNYQQYNGLLLGHGLFELSDLANVTVEKLLSLAGEQMNFGIANRLVTYAKEDFDQLSSHISKHARVD